MAVQAATPGRGTGLRFHWWWILLVVGVLLVAGVFAFAIFQPIKVLPRMRLAPGFTLVDQNGQRLTSEDLRGKVVLYNFLYTGCGAECEPYERHHAGSAAALARHRPGRPAGAVRDHQLRPRQRYALRRLQRYAESLGADTSQWRFATGDPARLKQLIGGGFEAYYAPDDAGGFQFDPTFVLVDGWGIIRGKYRYQVRCPTPTASCATSACWPTKCRKPPAQQADLRGGAPVSLLCALRLAEVVTRSCSGPPKHPQLAHTPRCFGPFGLSLS